MKSRENTHSKVRRTNLYITLVFVVLIVSLQALMWGYWQRILEPRLKREAASQANVLAHAQAGKLAAILTTGNEIKIRQDLREGIDEILLFADPETRKSIFKGVSLEVDYDVIPVAAGSLDVDKGVNQCKDCFISEVALYSPLSDELVGIAHFQVNNTLFHRLRDDVRRNLIIQSLIGMLLLLMVFGTVIILVREINRSRYQAEAASKAKSSFLANMSHELRTPLNSIIGFSELMKLDSQFPDQYRDKLSIIYRSGEYLLELINDVLELSRIEAGRSSIVETSFDLYATLHQINEMIRPRLEQKKLQFIFEKAEDVPQHIATDERKLRQILLNLLGNAVKFTEEGGVSLRVRARENKIPDDSKSLTLLFEIEDSGPGITQKDREKMFEAFTQANSGYSKKEGTGLGLAISRQFVLQLGGEISVSSRIGKGSIFSFTVCTKRAPASARSRKRMRQRVIGLQPSTAENETYRRILVVDDHQENRSLLCSILEPVGFLVETAENGSEAVRLNKEWHPHLIWMDMRMPIMNGYEATRQIRQSAQGEEDNQPIIIALTASAFKEDREAVLAAGCDDFVRRPFRQSEIFDKIGQHLGVEFRYKGVEEPELHTHLSVGNIDPFKQAELQELTGELVDALREAIELSDIETMNQLVDSIREENEELADELGQLIFSFQYDRILELLEMSRKQ